MDLIVSELIFKICELAVHASNCAKRLRHSDQKYMQVLALQTRFQ